MGEFLPTDAGIQEGLEFRVIDVLDFAVNSAPSANNTCTATFNQVDPDYYWEIERMTVQVKNPTGAALVLTSTAKIYAGDPGFPGNFRDSTLAGNFAVADNSSPIRLQPAQQLTVVWTNVDNACIGTAWVQIKKVKRVTIRRG